MGETKSYAVGHFAFGYILSRSSAELLKTRINIPLVLALSIIPDVDVWLSNFVAHRGPTHSIIMATLVFIPVLFIYRTKAVPYFVALVQHSLIGDLITGRNNQMLWPATTQYYGLNIDIASTTNMALEWTIFLISIIVMIKAKDIADLLSRRSSNLILAVPTFTVLLPTFVAQPIEVPPALMLPHIAYLVIFLASIIATCWKFLAMHKLETRMRSGVNR